MTRLAKVQAFNTSLFAEFIKRLSTLPDGGRHDAGQFDHSLRQQHEQQQPA